MKTKNKFYIQIIFIVFVFFISCEKNRLNNNENKLKAEYVYSNSNATSPYSTILYYYDVSGNLIKELTTNCPISICSSCLYEYSNDGQLDKKTYKVKNGLNYEGQTEADFSIIWEQIYKYDENKVTEERYKDNQLTNIIIYEYDSEDNLTKEIYKSKNEYVIYHYKNSKIIKTLRYNSANLLLDENLYTYIQSENTEIVEILYKGQLGEYVSYKKTYENGRVVEEVKYHPTFHGEEWFCKRYEYY